MKSKRYPRHPKPCAKRVPHVDTARQRAGATRYHVTH